MLDRDLLHFQEREPLAALQHLTSNAIQPSFALMMRQDHGERCDPTIHLSPLDLDAFTT